jgi:tetratricopeptide (TPR) repeat protein
MKLLNQTRSRGLYFLTFFILSLNFLLSQHLKAYDQDSVSFYFQSFDYEKVIELTENKSDISSLNYRATAFGALLKYEESIQILKQMLLMDSINIKTLGDLAANYSLMGNYKKSEEYYLKANAINPQNKYFIQQLGEVYYNDNKWDKAMKYYQIAIENDTSFQLLKQIGRCYEEQNNYDSAVFFYQKAISVNPSDFISNYRLSNLFTEKKEYDKALPVVIDYLEIDSLNLRMLKLAGLCYFMMEDYYKSNHQFEKCVLLKDSSEFLNKYYGFSLFRTRQFDPAKTYLEKAFKKDTLNANLCFAIGVSCYSSFYKELGIVYLKKAVKLLNPDPKFLSTVYTELGNAYAGYYKYDDALGSYMQALETNPEDTVLLFKIGSFYENRLNDKQNALIYYKRFLSTRPNSGQDDTKVPTGEGFTLSYYDFTIRKISELEEELFWEGDENQN